MFKNYLKIAFRNLWKNKGFSAINIIGLAIGLATCILIMLFVLDELSYDRYNKKADRIYRVDADIKFGGNHIVLVIIAAVIAFPLAWWFMHSWQDFAYRTNISWWVFIMAGIAAALIAVVTVSFQPIKAAISNPVNSLRAE